MVKERVIRGEDLEKTKKWAQYLVKQWHSKDPDYIFLTESSAVLYGYPLKEAWKKAYPNEKPPAFYRMDPGALSHRSGKNRKSKLSGENTEESEYFRKRIKKKNPNIIVYDEGSNEHDKSMKEFSLYSKNNKLNDRYMFNRSWNTEGAASRVARFIHEFLEDNELNGEIYASRQSNSVIRTGSLGKGQKSKFSKNPTSQFSGRKSDRPMSEDEASQNEQNFFRRKTKLTGTIVKHPEQRKRAMAYVKELKEIGKEAGEELAKQIGLEKRVTSILAICGLVLSLIFLSSNITGNAVANLTTKTSSILGAGLFFVGIIGSYFWFKKK